MKSGSAAALGARRRERERAAAVLDDIAEWAGDSDVYWVISPDQAESTLRNVDGLAEYELVGALEFPEVDPAGPDFPGGKGMGVPPPGGPGGPGGFGGPGEGRSRRRGGMFFGGSGPLEIYRLTIHR